MKSKIEASHCLSNALSTEKRSQTEELRDTWMSLGRKLKDTSAAAKVKVWSDVDTGNVGILNSSLLNLELATGKNGINYRLKDLPGIIGDEQ